MNDEMPGWDTGNLWRGRGENWSYYLQLTEDCLDKRQKNHELGPGGV